MCRQRIVAQARRWTLEARGSPLEERFVKAYGQLLSLLSKYDFHGHACLPPLKEDISYLAREDHSFSTPRLKEDRKPSAMPLQATSVTNIWQDDAAAFLTALADTQSAKVNPWASNQTAVQNPWSVPSGLGVKDDDQDDEDDELYE